MVIDRRRSQGIEEHSSMVLYSGPTCPESHRVRFILAEKEVAFSLEIVPNIKKLPEDLISINPQGNLPTLSDRNLMIDEPRIIGEYLDERFPHPPLMPVEPMPRTRLRLALHHIERHWYTCLKRVLTARASTAGKAKKELKDGVLAHIDMFNVKHFFISDEFSLVDCAIAPLLWRFADIGITLPPKPARLIARYRERVFSRPGFIRSLSKEERDMPLS